MKGLYSLLLRPVSSLLFLLPNLVQRARQCSKLIISRSERSRGYIATVKPSHKGITKQGV